MSVMYVLYCDVIYERKASSCEMTSGADISLVLPKPTYECATEVTQVYLEQKLAIEVQSSLLILVPWRN